MTIKTKVPDFTLRPAAETDCAEILSFIKGLAAYEKLSHEVVATEEKLRQTLFGPRPAAEVIIGEYRDEPVAFALFFHSYSTFLAQPGIYLEDLFRTGLARLWLRSRAPELSGAADAGARLRSPRMVGARLERTGHRFLPRVGGPAHGRVDRAPRHGPDARGFGCALLKYSSRLFIETP